MFEIGVLTDRKLGVGVLKDVEMLSNYTDLSAIKSVGVLRMWK